MIRVAKIIGKDVELFSTVRAAAMDAGISRQWMSKMLLGGGYDMGDIIYVIPLER